MSKYNGVHILLLMHANVLRFFSAKMVTLISVLLPHGGIFSETNEYAEADDFFRFFNISVHVLDFVDFWIVPSWIVDTFVDEMELGKSSIKRHRLPLKFGVCFRRYPTEISTYPTSVSTAI